MKVAIVATALLASAAFAPSASADGSAPAPASAPAAPEVAVEFRFGPHDHDEASIVAALFDSLSNFEARRPLRSVRLAPGVQRWRVEDLEPGRYALLAFIDVDGDGELGVDERGLPVEPFTASGRGPLRRPGYARAVIDLQAPAQRVDLLPWRQLRARRR